MMSITASMDIGIHGGIIPAGVFLSVYLAGTGGIPGDIIILTATGTDSGIMIIIHTGMDIDMQRLRILGGGHSSGVRFISVPIIRTGWSG